MKHCYFILLSTLIFIFYSCSNLRKVPAGDALFVGVSVKVEDSSMTARQRRNMRKELVSLTRPQPNTKTLGMRTKLWAYNYLPKSIGRKIGEEQVLLSQVDLDRNSKVLQTGLENRGYFNAFVEGDTTIRGKKARATYSVKPGVQYVINDVRFDSNSTVVSRTITGVASKTLLKPGDPFDLAVIKDERIRIDGHLKENGFFYFDSDYIIAQADSTTGNNKVSLFLKVKPNTPPESLQPYRINEVYILPNYRLDAPHADTSKANAEYYEGYYVVDQRKRYKPRLFTQSMQFDPGDVYNRTDHIQTINRLVSLGLFKFVKNRFERVPGSDSALLNAYYYLTPLPKRSLRAELNASTKSNNLTGSSITIGWKNRNTFKSGVLFSINANASFEVQFGGKARGFNTFGAGFETGLDFPRFYVPFVNLKLNTKGGYVPHTQILLGYDLLRKQKLYSMQSFRGSFGYLWRQNFKTEHQFHPININYAQPVVITQLFKDSAANNASLMKAVEKQFILGSDYKYTYNELKEQSPIKGRYFSGTYFSGTIDLSGNIAGLITKANVNNGNQKNLFGAPFSQYIKLESDVRRYLKLSPNSAWANRLIIGVGFPYGNSRELPFIKQFFIGGNNSLRAFRTRSLGPGTFQAPISNFFLPDQSGDIKLELNTELRVRLINFLHGALFVDAGNIWLFNENPDKPGAKFSGDFLKELAVGGGVGFRFDITFLVVRLDIAVPFRKPYLPEGERWVISKMDFGSKSWRRDNIIYNLGIGYPF
ncbi:MAG TPA: BamA/TamA family outer membrane protein [Chitinophagaceae bacterium]